MEGITVTVRAVDPLRPVQWNREQRRFQSRLAAQHNTIRPKIGGMERSRKPKRETDSLARLTAALITGEGIDFAALQASPFKLTKAEQRMVEKDAHRVSYSTAFSYERARSMLERWWIPE